jgi:Protein of unknown function (DUF2528)
MIKNYEFKYNIYEAEVSFTVDTNVFTKEHANATLEFFTWDYDKDADPIDEVMKKYAMEAIKIATFNGYNEYGVKREFEGYEGYCRVDGSMGITLTHIFEYEFNEGNLVMKVSEQE